MPIILKTSEEIQKIKEAGLIAKKILDTLENQIDVGITTKQIDEWAVELMQEFGVVSATLGYRGFPASVCTSVNHVVCHGIPNHKRLKSGDILNVDITVIKDGWHGDLSRMYAVGNVNRLAKKFVQTTQECLNLAIETIRPGVRLGTVGHIIQKHAEKHSYSVVRDYCGHGIGQSFHEKPHVLHYGKKNVGTQLQEGMTFTIEPMLNMGKETTKVLGDGWTVIAKDRSLSAQWEHTVAVVQNGVEILTE